jgi:hypothetical protein
MFPKPQEEQTGIRETHMRKHSSNIPETYLLAASMEPPQKGQIGTEVTLVLRLSTETLKRFLCCCYLRKARNSQKTQCCSDVAADWNRASVARGRYTYDCIRSGPATQGPATWDGHPRCLPPKGGDAVATESIRTQQA